MNTLDEGGKTRQGGMGHVDARGDPYSVVTQEEINGLLQAEARHQALAERTVIRMASGGIDVDPNSCDGRFLLFASSLLSLHGRLVGSDEPVLRQVKTTWAKRPGRKLTKLGREIWGVCNRYADAVHSGDEWLQRYGGLRLHPSVSVVLDAVCAEWCSVIEITNPDIAVAEGESIESALSAVDRFCASIRSRSSRLAFRNQINAHDRKADSNFRSAMKLIGALFSSRARMLVLRVDLYIRSEGRSWKAGADVEAALDGFLRSVRDGAVVPGYLGFILKRENGVSRGVHFHLLVMLDGHEHKATYYLTSLLGEAWVSRIGADRASYFNCYGRSDSYLFNGLGLVHYTDVRKLLGLRLAIWYLSKQDCLLHVDGERVRHFRRSVLPRATGKRGAPRLRQGCEIVESMLSGGRSRIPNVLATRVW